MVDSFRRLALQEGITAGAGVGSAIGSLLTPAGPVFEQIG